MTLKGIPLVHLSPTPRTIFLTFSLLSYLPLSISFLWLMRTLSTGSRASPLSFFQKKWLKFTSFQNGAKWWRALYKRRGKGDWPTEPDEGSLVEITLRKERENKLNGDEDGGQKRGQQKDRLHADVKGKPCGNQSRRRRYFELMAGCLGWQRIFSNLLVCGD